MQFRELPDISSATARFKRLSLSMPERPAHLPGPISLIRLMDHSMQRMEMMVASSLPEEAMVAERIFECPRSFSRWESEHAGVMQRVARQHRTPAQNRELLAGTFELIHRKSFFAHLRRHKVSGRDRDILLKHFWPVQGAVRGMIAEHGIFLRSYASQCCSSYVGAQVLCDAVFHQPLHDYEQLYGSYFDAYCEWVLQQADPQRGHMAQSMVYSIKCDLGILRRTIMDLAARLRAEDDDSLLDELMEQSQGLYNPRYI